MEHPKEGERCAVSAVSVLTGGDGWVVGLGPGK